jgi:predicted AAA+ superfamily ATPase
MSSFNENDEDENFYNNENRDYLKPKIILFGLRRSGKSSIQKVVFHKMSPNETLFLESTNKVYTGSLTWLHNYHNLIYFHSFRSSKKISIIQGQ